MADEEEIENEEAEKSKSSSSGKLLPIIMIVLLVAALGLGGFNAWKIQTMNVSPSEKNQQLQAKTAGIKLKTIIVTLGGITVNLADEGESRYLHVKIKIAVEGKAHQAALAAFAAPVKDLIITSLSSKTVKDIRTQQGKFALKQELAYRINTLIGDTIVKKIYFSDFVVQ